MAVFGQWARAEPDFRQKTVEAYEAEHEEWLAGLDARVAAEAARREQERTERKADQNPERAQARLALLKQQVSLALARRRRSLPGPFPPSEGQALNAVRDRLPPGTSEAVGDRILDAALVMTVATETEQDSDFRYAASLLDGTVVASGSGSAAVRALQRAFQEQAAAGTGSGMDEWLEVLAAAGLDVFQDADGPAGARRRAELNAVAAHRRRLAARDGLLEYSLLADDLPPLRYEQLAESFRVSVIGATGPEGDADFLALARRWPRMLLTGLPGTGKSTALQQMAARWAAIPWAPVPVLVPLLEVARRGPRSAPMTAAN